MSILLSSNVLMVVAGLALFAAVMFVVLGVDAFIVERRNLSRRLTVQSEVAPATVESDQPRAVFEDALLKRFADFVTPKDADELAAARKKLVRAGYRSPSAVRVYNMAKPVLGLAFALGSLLLSSFLGKSVTPPIQLLIALVAGLIGFLLPFLWVERLVERRREEAELAFPDMLDMLLICIEAGSGIDHAARRVANEVAGVSPVLAQELAVVNSELWAGKQRASVFRDFADRLGVPDIRAFATVLKQSDEFGVSIAEALRVYASDMRLKRVMRAEEKANVMPVKVALGSILFTVPPTMIIMAGPSFVVLMRIFGAMH
jgi:tight adherence protein C